MNLELRNSGYFRSGTETQSAKTIAALSLCASVADSGGEPLLPEFLSSKLILFS
jgi:hypothetical protein